MLKKFHWKTVVAAAALCASVGLAAAEEMKLILATTNAPEVDFNKNMLHPWAARVNEAGKGVIQLDVRDGVAFANHSNFYSRVLDDVAQVSWGITSYIGGKFPLTDVVTIPFESGNGKVSSVALWRLYKSGALNSEFNQVVPLFLTSLPQSGLHFAKQPKSLHDLNGLKVAVVSKAMAQAVKLLGATPMSMPAPEIYEAIQRGTVDAVGITWGGMATFKLQEVTNYHVETSLGGTPAMVFMAKAKYDALPQAVRDVLTQQSAEKQSLTTGTYFDDLEQRTRKRVQDLGHPIVTLSAEDAADWKKKVAPMAEEWAKSVPGGDKVLPAFRDQMAKASAGG